MSATADPPSSAVEPLDGSQEAAAATGPAECPFHATAAADRAAVAALFEVSTGAPAPSRRLGLPAALRVAPDESEVDALPPGPDRAGFRQTLDWIRDPAGFMERCAAEFGTTFTVRIGPGADVVLMSDPADVAQVFQGSPEQMNMGDINGLFRRVLGRDSLLVIDGEQHLRQRKLLLPPFKGRRIAEHQDAMVAAAEEDVAGWPADRPFALQPRMQAMTLDVILRAVFGLEAGPRRDGFRTLLARLLELNTTMATTLPLLRREAFGLSPWGRLMRCTREVDAAVYEEIQRRRADPQDHGDVLSLLLAARDEAGEPMSDRELRDQLLTMLVAGHETTATALAWAFERLLREPEVLGRVRDDLDAGSTTYLDATIKETLRLRPTVPIAARKLTEDYEVGGRTYAAGTVLMPCIYLLHRNPAVWEDPEAFRPERFLAGALPSYGWIPFGGGVRRCMGSGFALAEMRAVMRVVLARMDLRVAERPAERIVRRAFTLSPSRGARVVATPRA